MALSPAPCRAVATSAVVGAIFGIAAHDALEGAEVESQLTGVIEIDKVGSQAWSAGDKVCWDNAALRATSTATDTTAAGVAVLPDGAGAEAMIGRVRLNASFCELSLQPEALMPFGDALLRIAIEGLVARAEARLDPGRPAAEHEVGARPAGEAAEAAGLARDAARAHDAVPG
jgi:predicted RecA/RadA family phage recombinase